MVDLRTHWLGFELKHPFLPGASPLVDDLDTVRRLEDAGAAAIVMHSLFEEQLTAEEVMTIRHLESPGESFGEATSYLPSPGEFKLGPDEYLDQLQDIKRAVAVPVIASLNGTTQGGWLRYATLIQDAGADALELNVYEVVTDGERSGQAIEHGTLEVLREVRQRVKIPIAVKLSPFYTSLAHFARRLAKEGIQGLVLFNRFFETDLDVENLEVTRQLKLSTPHELLLRLRWLALLHGQVHVPLCVSGGVASGLDAVKALMCGAEAVQVVSALLRHGPEHLSKLVEELDAWLEAHEYESLAQLRGSMSLTRCPDPHAYERANYVRMLQGWQ